MLSFGGEALVYVVCFLGRGIDSTHFLDEHLARLGVVGNGSRGRLWVIFGCGREIFYM